MKYIPFVTLRSRLWVIWDRMESELRRWRQLYYIWHINLCMEFLASTVSSFQSDWNQTASEHSYVRSKKPTTFLRSFLCTFVFLRVGWLEELGQCFYVKIKKIVWLIDFGIISSIFPHLWKSILIVSQQPLTFHSLKSTTWPPYLCTSLPTNSPIQQTCTKNPLYW